MFDCEKRAPCSSFVKCADGRPPRATSPAKAEAIAPRRMTGSGPSDSRPRRDDWNLASDATASCREPGDSASMGRWPEIPRRYEGSRAAANRTLTDDHAELDSR